MKVSKILTTLSAVSLAKSASVQQSAITVTDEHTNKSSPYLYGFIFEDINHCGDGGLYGELLINRALQGPSYNVSGNEGVGGTYIRAAQEPISDALPMTMEVVIPPNHKPEVGFYNKGWFGIDVKKGETYQLGFYVKTPKGFDGEFKVSLRDTTSLKHYADATAEKQQEDTLLYPAESNGFVRYTAELTAEEDGASINNGLFIVLEDGKKYKHQSFFFSVVSLFAENYKGRENGLRKDLGELLEGLKPTMMRFPGGNDLQSNTIPSRWKWNETIGPLIDRPGHAGGWYYTVSDGLGLHEYFEWCEDMHIEPILGLYAGMSLHGLTVPEEDFQPFLDEAMDELEYVLGDESTKWGKVRAQNGREEPWDLKFVELGNEDWFGEGYDYRFNGMHSAIDKKYPNLTMIATTDNNITLPDDGTWLDLHYYKNPQFWVDGFDQFDNIPRNNTPISVGEYANQRFDNQSRHHLPFLIGSVGEAVYMFGMERNSDQVLYSAYAPLLENHNDFQAAGPSMIAFNAEFSNFTLSTSYYTQKFICSHAGDEILELQNTNFGPYYYVASRNTKKDEIYLKIANPSDKTGTLQFELKVGGKDSFEVTEADAISHTDPYAQNVPYQQPQVTPYKPKVSVDGTKISVQVDPYFVGVVVLK